jgi:hypothetical protein
MTDQELLNSFRHLPDGNWLCIKPVLIDGSARNIAIVPGVTISRINMFMGFDLARELDLAEDRQTH